MKNTTKPNALKVFNDNKVMAYKKAGGAMSDYKKYLKKANDGMSVTDPPTSGTQGPSAAKDFVPASSGRIPLTEPTVSYSRNDLPFVNAGTIGLNGQPIGKTAADAINRQMRRDSAAGRDVKAPFKRRGGSTKMAKGGAASFGMLSVKAGIDKNPKPTAADRIAGAKKKNKRK